MTKPVTILIFRPELKQLQIIRQFDNLSTETVLEIDNFMEGQSREGEKVYLRTVDFGLNID